MVPKPSAPAMPSCGGPDEGVSVNWLFADRLQAGLVDESGQPEAGPMTCEVVDPGTVTETWPLGVDGEARGILRDRDRRLAPDCPARVTMRPWLSL